MAASLHPPVSALDADMCVQTLIKVLHGAAKAASPVLHMKRSKRGFSIWNKRVAAAVQNSKVAHYIWRCADCPRGNSGLMRKKEARTSMRRVLRMTLYQQKQDDVGKR